MKCAKTFIRIPSIKKFQNIKCFLRCVGLEITHPIQLKIINCRIFNYLLFCKVLYKVIKKNYDKNELYTRTKKNEKKVVFSLFLYLSNLHLFFYCLQFIGHRNFLLDLMCLQLIFFPFLVPSKKIIYFVIVNC